MNDGDNVQLPVVYKRPPGRPQSWSQEIEDAICARIIMGESLTKICEDPGMPSIQTVILWRRTRPLFSERYAQAREDQADTYADLMMQVAFETNEDWAQDADGVWKPNHDVVQRARLKIDTLKWIVAKLKPGTYGERVETKISGQVNHAHAHAMVDGKIDATEISAEDRAALRQLLLSRRAAKAEEDS